MPFAVRLAAARLDAALGRPRAGVGTVLRRICRPSPADRQVVYLRLIARAGADRAAAERAARWYYEEQEG